jgi:hypothetical protein
MDKWTKRIHPIHIKYLSRGLKNSMLGKYQYSMGELDIVRLLYFSNQPYELYDGKDTYQFKTLKEAKKYGEKLIKNNIYAKILSKREL